MNTLIKLTLTISALIAASALAWIAWHGVFLDVSGLELHHHTDNMELNITHN